MLKKESVEQENLLMMLLLFLIKYLVDKCLSTLLNVNYNYSLFLLYLVRKEYFPFSFYSLYNDVFEIEVHLYPCEYV